MSKVICIQCPQCLRLTEVDMDELETNQNVVASFDKETREGFAGTKKKSKKKFALEDIEMETPQTLTPVESNYSLGNIKNVNTQRNKKGNENRT